MYECHQVAAGSRSGCLVYQPNSGGLEGGERAGKIVDLEADVVQTGSPVVEETSQTRVARRTRRGDDLKRRFARRQGRLDGGRPVVRLSGRGWPRTQERYVGLLAGDVLAWTHGKAEKTGESSHLEVAIAGRDGHVIDAFDLNHGKLNPEGRRKVRSTYQRLPGLESGMAEWPTGRPADWMDGKPLKWMRLSRTL